MIVRMGNIGKRRYNQGRCLKEMDIINEFLGIFYLTKKDKEQIDRDINRIMELYRLQDECIKKLCEHQNKLKKT